VFLQNFGGLGELPELLNYFSIEKSVNRVYGTVARVHGAGACSPWYSEMISSMELTIDSRDLIS
jgi:hypothetical protein